MPMFFGCMSSKQAKSPPDSKATKKVEQRDSKGRDAIQNGGEQMAGECEPAEPPSDPASPTSNDASLSQVDVREAVTADVTSEKSSESERGQRQSFPTRPETIVREDCLISEIVSALAIGNGESAGKDGENTEVGKSPTQTPAPSAETRDGTPSAEGGPPTSTPTERAEKERKKGTQESEEPAPPTPPPRTKTSDGVASADSDGLSPPSLPPRSVMAAAAPACVESITQRSQEAPGEDTPPLLPPRCVPPSPPRLSISSTCSLSMGLPPKPRRCSTDSSLMEDQGVLVRRAKPASFREPPPLPDDWAVIELPKTDAELIRLTRQPEQLANMASQYVLKHISLHTDVRVTADLSDQIHAAFLAVSRQQRAILHRFLTDLIEDQANSLGGGGAEPSHGAVIVLAKDILRQFVTVESVVKPSLEIVRAVSPAAGSTGALVECDVVSSVLGCMSAHRASANVQCCCLHVLATVALCPPCPTQQPALEQSGVDLICLSLETFPKSVTVTKAGCHVLSNLVSTLYKAVSSIPDRGDSSHTERDKWTLGLLDLMDYIFSQGLPAVRRALKCHDQEPNVKSHGRQCLVVYSQLQQFRQRKKQRCSDGSSPTLSPPPLPVRRPPGLEKVADCVEQATEGAVLDTKVPSSAYTAINHNMEYENWDLLRGVLKKKSSLRGHLYSKCDLQFMQQLTKTQVVGLVCALAVDGHVQEALSLLDQPVSEMMMTTQVPPGVKDFVAHHCSASQTLIDLDPGLFVSLIDAVRYPSLSYQMAQKCVLEVASSLNDEQQVPVVAVTVEFLASTITNRPLAPAMTVPAFVDAVCGQLERAKAVSKNSGALTTLLSEIRQCARKTKHNP